MKSKGVLRLWLHVGITWRAFPRDSNWSGMWSENWDLKKKKPQMTLTYKLGWDTLVEEIEPPAVPFSSAHLFTTINQCYQYIQLLPFILCSNTFFFSLLIVSYVSNHYDPSDNDNCHTGSSSETTGLIFCIGVFCILLTFPILLGIL